MTDIDELFTNLADLVATSEPNHHFINNLHIGIVSDLEHDRSWQVTISLEDTGGAFHDIAVAWHDSSLEAAVRMAVLEVDVLPPP